MLGPLIVSILVMALAYGVYRVGPEMLDHGKSFKIVVGSFLVIYILAVAYVTTSMPSIEEIIPARARTTENAPADQGVRVRDVVVNSDNATQ